MVSDVEGVTLPPVNSFVTDLGHDHDFSTYQHSCSFSLFSQPRWLVVKRKVTFPSWVFAFADEFAVAGILEVMLYSF